jgi:hypothetical protein
MKGCLTKAIKFLTINCQNIGIRSKMKLRVGFNTPRIQACFLIFRRGCLHTVKYKRIIKIKEKMRQKRNLQFRCKAVVYFCLSVFIFFGNSRFVQAEGRPIAKVAVAYRIAKENIKIDGRMNEAVWKNAPPISGFVQYEPDEGRPATESTVVQVVYDDEALYIGFRALDSRALQIRGCLTRRDLDSPSDWIGFAVDSYADRRTAFVFLVNPAGVKFDSRMSEDSVQDPNWDAIWDVGTKIYKQGWVAEFRIPYSQLRFPNQKEQAWGFQAMRVVARKNETTYWSPLRKDAAGFVSLFGTLRGLVNLPPSEKMQFLPYAKATSDDLPDRQRHPAIDDPRQDWDLGLDIKYPLSSNSALDISVNPDFGQVESDPSQFNLTAYETYYDEKRPFFIEGSHLFGYSVGFGQGEMADGQLFYSRRIGKTPTIQFSPSSELGVMQPRATRILGAAKISGRTADGWSIGILDAVTPEESATVYDETGQYQRVVEPMANYFVSRFQRDFDQGNTTFGGIVTSVMREDASELSQRLNRTATAAGIDYSHKWDNQTYEIDFSLMGSAITGDTLAIQFAQTSSARYFQRSDAYHLAYDPKRTSLTGFAGKFYLRKISTGHWRWSLGTMTKSPGFEINDLGFLNTADFNAAYGWLSYNEYKPGLLLRDYDFSVQGWKYWSYGAEPIGTGIQLIWQGRFLNYTAFYLSLIREQEVLNTGLLRGGPAFLTPGHTSFLATYSTDERKPVRLYLYGSFGRTDTAFNSWCLAPSLTFRPAGRLSLTLTTYYEKGYDDLQYVWQEVQDEQTQYLLARLKQQSFYATLRLNLTLTPDLTIQYYGMPYIFAGQYQKYHVAKVPRAIEYRDRLEDVPAPYDLDFNFQEFKSNLVLRWEYRAGSTVYFVWSQGATNYLMNGRLDIARNTQSLLETQPENIFLLKISRWLSF